MNFFRKMKTIRRKQFRQYFFCIFISLFLLILEENYYGFFRIYFGNYYNNVVYLPIEKFRNDSDSEFFLGTNNPRKMAKRHKNIFAVVLKVL